MECIDNESFLYWLNHYGSLGLFILLALGIFALPIPDETLLIFSGLMIRNGHLNPVTTILCAIAGGMFGITLSYIFGRTCGHFAIENYGSWIGLTKERIEKGLHWFEKYGKWTLFFGYFIPGIRHVNGLVAGMLELDYRLFALFSYLGAILWASFFILVGYFFGDYCFTLFQHLNLYLEEIFIAFALLLFFYLIYKIIKKNSQPL